MIVSIVVLKMFSLFFVQKLCARCIHLFFFYIKYLKERSTMKHIEFKNRIILFTMWILSNIFKAIKVKWFSKRDSLLNRLEETNHSAGNNRNRSWVLGEILILSTVFLGICTERSTFHACAKLTTTSSLFCAGECLFQNSSHG